MATVTGEFHCCSDCACLIANGDTSGVEYHGSEYYRNWIDGISASRDELPEGNPVIVCPEGCAGDNEQEFMCDYCSRNVFSHKVNLAFLN